MITVEHARDAYPITVTLRELDDLIADVQAGKAFACAFHGRYDDDMAEQLRTMALGVLSGRRATLTQQLRELGVVEADDRHAAQA